MNALPDSALFAPAAATAEPAIVIDRLGKTFDPAVGPVLDDVSLTIGQGDIYGIIGRSGAGKSTLVRCINNLEHPTSGRVLVAGRDVTALSGAELRSARRGIGMIFQHFNLLSSRTVAGNVALPLEVIGLSRTEIARRIPPLLELVGLADKAKSYPSELSGGQKQRVGIARALATNPSVLLCDEATSALDPETTLQILSLLRDINRRLGLTIVLITHEMEVLRDIASHVAVLEHGRLVEEGGTFDVLAFPKSAVARSFLSGLVAHELPPPVERRLRIEPGPDTDPVIRIIFSGDNAHQPVFADLIHRFPVEPNILHGRIDYIGDRPLGVLTLTLRNGEPHVGAIAAHLSSLGLKSEVIGHDPRLP